MIEDEELRNVFKTASEEHLQKLDEGFLYLEKYPDDTAKLEELLRETHSLKGDAGMLGVKDVSTLAHQLEHLLGAIKRGETVLTRDLSDRLFQGLETIRKLVHEAVTGTPSGVNTFYALANLMGAATSQSRSAKEEPERRSKQQFDLETPAITHAEPPIETLDFLESQSEPTNDYKIPETIPESQPILQPVVASVAEVVDPQVTLPALDAFPVPAPDYATPPVLNTSPTTATYRIETIRVATQNLDALMTQAGELTVTKIRLAHQLSEIEEITVLWEEWSRETFLNRFALHELETHQAAFHLNGMLTQLQKYHQSAEERLEQLGRLVNRLRTGIHEDTARLDLISGELEEGIRTLRLLPLSTIFNLFPRLVRDLARQQDKEVELMIEGGETTADKRILEEMKDPLMHLLRNAIDHGIETPSEREKMGKPPGATLRLRGYHTATNIVIEVSDDGRGLDIERIKQTAIKRAICTEEELATLTPSQIQSLIFAPGFSTRTFVTEVSGRGVGLDVVRTNVEVLKGTIQVESVVGKGCTFRLQLGTTLATAHVLIVAVEGIAYALPVEFVQTTRLVAESDIFCLEGRETIILENQPLSVAQLADLLELKNWNWKMKPAHRKELDSHQKMGEQKMISQLAFMKESLATVSSLQQKPCIILKIGEERLGLFVDALIDEQDVVIKPQSQLLKRVRNVAGATILGTGEVCMVLNPQDLIKSVRKQTGVRVMPTATYLEGEAGGRKQVILLAEDSIATRTQEKRILEAAGYEVVTAVDGLDAFNKLKTRNFDALVSDVQMPNLDGLSLTAKIRQFQEYRELPIILVTSLASDEDKKRGADAGANAYITKGTFNQEVLLETLQRLV